MKALIFSPSPARWVAARLAGVVRGPSATARLSGLRLREVPPPPLPGPDWVRLRPILGGICGTDIALLTLRNHPASILRSFVSFPAVLGHENVSRIEEVGRDAGRWAVGQRVCVDPALSCAARGITPWCASCTAGCTSLCENVRRGILPPGLMIGLNTATGGTWSASFVAHGSQVFAVPDDVPDEIAVLTDPIACALHAVLRRPPIAGERVLVNGGGVIGLGLTACLRALGFDNPLTAVVRHPFQAAWMQKFGATDTRVQPRGWSHARRYDDVAASVGGERVAGSFGNQMLQGGFELSYDCIGSGQSFTDVMKWTRSRGTAVLVGTSQISVVDTTPLWLTELQVVGCNGRQIEHWQGQRRHTYEVVWELLRAGRLRLDGMLSHRFGLSQYRQALSTLLSRGSAGVIKAAFMPE